MDGIMQSKLFATRQGTIVLGVIAAVIAAIALIVYLNSYRNSVNGSAVSSVLTATSLIQKGTSGAVIGTNDLSAVSKRSDLQSGALVDPSELAGQVAVKDIYPGQQLTKDDFGPATGSLSEGLSQTQRAVVIPLDSAPQVGGQIGAGSHVDVWVSNQSASSGRSSETLLYQDVYVLGVNGENVTLRTAPRQAGVIIFYAHDSNSNIWFALRPTVAKNVPGSSGAGG